MVTARRYVAVALILLLTLAACRGERTAAELLDEGRRDHGRRRIVDGKRYHRLPSLDRPQTEWRPVRHFPSLRRPKPGKYRTPSLTTG